MKHLLKLLRPTQWIKNIFVFVPLVFSGAFVSLDAVVEACLATLMFCFAASAIYIINDLHDIELDRLHASKSRVRPLASGAVTVKVAGIVLILLLTTLIAVSYYLFPDVLLVLLGYIGLMIAYTYILKHQPILDIFTIAIGFVLRLYAGAIAIDVPVSPWAFVTTLSLALYLAAIKRRQELKLHGAGSREVLKHYSESLVSKYAEISATGALVFYSLYVLSERPELIMTIPVVLFGLFRYWYIVETYESGESPTDALLKDGQLMLTVLVWIIMTGVLIWSNQ